MRRAASDARVRRLGRPRGPVHGARARSPRLVGIRLAASESISGCSGPSNIESFAKRMEQVGAHDSEATNRCRASFSGETESWRLRAGADSDLDTVRSLALSSPRVMDASVVHSSDRKAYAAACVVMNGGDPNRRLITFVLRDGQSGFLASRRSETLVRERFVVSGRRDRDKRLVDGKGVRTSLARRTPQS